MINKDIEAALPKPPKGYFWRVGHNPTLTVIVNSKGEIEETQEALDLSLRRKRSFFSFNFSSNVQSENSIYIGDGFSKLEEKAQKMNTALVTKLDKTNKLKAPPISYSHYLGDYHMDSIPEAIVE